MLRVLTSIIRSSYNSNYSFWYWLTGSTTIRSRCWGLRFFFPKNKWNYIFFLLIIIWERKWQEKYRNKRIFCILTYVSFLPPDGTCVALALPSQNHASMNINPQPKPTETELFVVSKTILWLLSLHRELKSITGTENERQRKKGKDKRRGQEGRKGHLDGGTLNTVRVKGICSEFETRKAIQQTLVLRD